MNESDPRAARFKEAVFSGDSEALVALFGRHPELAEVIDAPWFHFGKPAIAQAAGSHDRTLVDTLAELGADLDARSDWDAGPYTALHTLVDGATEESLALAEHLAELGAEVDLHAAAGMGRADRIEEILDREPHRVSEPGPDGATPLHLAKDVPIARLLLDRGAEIDKRCVDHKSTPAMWAVQGREDVMRFLVERGARPDLFMAVLMNDVALATRILEAEPTAIEARVYFGHSHEHLGGGDKYTWALGGPDTPVELARVREKSEIYGFLLERSSVGTRLVQASRRGDVAEIERLLAESPDVLQRIEEREVCEALHGSANGAGALLRLGADPNARDDRAGATALHHAGWGGDEELARALLGGGADPYLRDRDYDATPIGWAHENGQKELMALITAHAPPDIVDAAWLGDAERVGEILDTDPSLVDGLEGGRISPLRSAAWMGRVAVVKTLLERGADASLPNPSNQRTALELARERGHEEVVALLEAAAAAS